MLDLYLLLSSTHRVDDRRVAALTGLALLGAGFSVLHAGRAGENFVLSFSALSLQRRSGVSWRLLGLLRLASFAFKVRPRVVIANEPDTWGLALLCKAALGCRVVFDSHEDYCDEERLCAVPSALRKLVANVLGNVFVFLSRLSDGVLGVTSERIRFFPLPRQIPGLLVVRNAICRREALGHGRGNAATMSRLDAFAIGAMGRSRGWPEIVGGIAAISSAPVRCMIIGSVTDSSGGALSEEIRRGELVGRIILTGFLPRAVALEKAASSQVGVVMFTGGGRNQKTGLPHKVFEIIALGLPVVVARTACMTAILVEDVQCGIVVDVVHQHGFAKGIVDLFFRPLARLEMGELARLASLGRLAWEEDAIGVSNLCFDLD